MNLFKSILTTASLMIALLPCLALASQNAELLAKIERLAMSDPNSFDHALGEIVADEIRFGSPAIANELIVLINDPSRTDQQLMMYAWALGLTRNQDAAKELITLYDRNDSEMVRANCLRALAAIGNETAGEFLLSTLNGTSDGTMRFTILNMLGQMQYEDALPSAMELLEADPAQFYWQSIFVFGKMGDKAVPFLLTKLGDRDRNVRANAINVLGQWLIPPEAAGPIEEQFWLEDDKVLRGFQLSSLERTIPDLDEMKATFERIAAKEQDPDLRTFANEAIEMIEQSQFTAGAENKRISAESFQQQYDELFNSAGKKGDYEILANSSSVNDEAKLKALRERILQRDSDEAFYDYQNINRMILLNRWLNK